VRLGDVLGVGMEDVERQQALRPQPLPGSREDGAPLGVGGEVKEGAEGDGDEPETAELGQ
jgi:hypothetical protein